MGSKSLAICFVLLAAVAHAAVLGIDFGTQYMKIAIVRPGYPFEIVTDLSSKRKTPSAIAFDDSTRVYGFDAINLGARKPKNVFQRMSRMLGQGPESEFSKEFEELKFPYEFKLTERNTWSVKFPKGTGFDDIEYLTAEEVNAMILEYARKLGEMFDEGGKIMDCVITVPVYSTQHQRQAILDAASLIGLNVLSLIEEPTAAALQYTVNKEFVNKTHRVMFYDMGAGSVQTSIAEFHTVIDKKTKLPKRYFNILSKAWDTTLGGAHLTKILSEKFALDFKEQHGLDVNNLIKPEYRLRLLGEKLKEMLSVNEKLPVNEGTLYDERDLATMATKAFIEENSEHLVKRLLAPALKALEDAGLKSEDLQAVEVIGGSIRVPLFQKTLREGLGREALDMHMNGDEAVALGSAFRAANVSTAFKPRFVGMTDRTAFSVGLELYRTMTEEEEAALVMAAAEADQANVQNANESGEETIGEEEETPALDRESEKRKHDFLLRSFKKARSMDLFAKNAHHKTQRKITLQAYEDFQAHLYYSRPEELPANSVTPIATYNVTGIADALTALGEKRLGLPNVTLVFSTDLNGMVGLKDAYIKMRYEYQEQVPVKKEKATMKLDEESKKAEEEKKKKDEEKPAEAEPAPEGEAENETKTEAGAGAGAGAGAETGAETKTEGEPQAEPAPEPQEKPVEEEMKKEEKKEKKEEEPVEMVSVTKRKIRKVSLRVSSLTDRLVILPLSTEQKQQSISLLRRLRERDEAHRERQRIINQHEAFVYDSQSRLEEEEFIEFSTEEEREEISKLLSENEDWLMDEAGPDTPTDEFKSKFLDMKTAMNRVENRIDEHKRKLEEERRKKEEEERKKKEEEEKAKKEAEEAEKKAKKEAEEAEKKAKEEAKEAETPETPETVETPEVPESEKPAEKKEEENDDEGMCTLDGKGCSEDSEL